jgi:hypothetical protein
MTTAQDAPELIVRPDGTVWERWYDRDDGGWQQARAVFWTDEGIIGSLPDVVIDTADVPIHRNSGRPLEGCRWATPDDARNAMGATPQAPAPVDPPLMVGEVVPAFLAASCSTVRERVLVDIGHQAVPDGPVFTLTISADVQAAIELYRSLSGALRYLGVNTDALWPDTVTMTDRY